MTNTQQPEKILCIPREAFESNEVFQGFRSLAGREDLGEYINSHPDHKVAFFHPRPEAEIDETKKQIISYCLIMCGDSVLTYERGKKGNEARLHAQLSVGIGGHVDESDDPEEYFFAYQNSVKRELKEEIGLEIDHNAIKNTVIGLVNDDSNPVGRVHLGVVHVIQVDEIQAQRILQNCENTFVNPSFVPLSDFHDEKLASRLESWSAYIIEHLFEQDKGEGKWNDPAFKERIGLLSMCASRLAGAATGLVLQDGPRGHAASVAAVEEEMGNLHCMYSGVIANKDINPEKMTEHGNAFREILGGIMKHQQIKTDDPS